MVVSRTVLPVRCHPAPLAPRAQGGWHLTGELLPLRRDLRLGSCVRDWVGDERLAVGLRPYAQGPERNGGAVRPCRRPIQSEHQTFSARTKLLKGAIDSKVLAERGLAPEVIVGIM